jgi:hypothetical protein
VFGDRIDAVIIRSVPLMLDLIDLGRDHEDFFEVWAVASEKNGRRVDACAVRRNAFGQPRKSTQAS